MKSAERRDATRSGEALSNFPTSQFAQGSLARATFGKRSSEITAASITGMIRKNKVGR